MRVQQPAKAMPNVGTDQGVSTLFKKCRPMHDGFTNKQQLICPREEWHVSWPRGLILDAEKTLNGLIKPYTTFQRILRPYNGL